MRRKEVWIAIIAGCAGAVLTLAVCSVMQLGAQNGDATFGQITCTRLNVGGENPVVSVNGKEGSVMLFTDSDGGAVWVYTHADGGVPAARMGVNHEGGGSFSVWKVPRLAAKMTANDTGGMVSLQGAVGGSSAVVTSSLIAVGEGEGKNTSSAELSIGEHGGSVRVYGRGGTGSDNTAQLSINEDGGRLNIFGRGSTDGSGSVQLGITEHGGGRIDVNGKGANKTKVQMTADKYGNGAVIIKGGTEESGAVKLGVDEHGGEIHVYGKVDDKSRGAMGVNEYGNGVVNTWDKNGYRLADLHSH